MLTSHTNTGHREKQTRKGGGAGGRKERERERSILRLCKHKLCLHTAIHTSLLITDASAHSLTPSNGGDLYEHGSSSVSLDPLEACAPADWPGSVSICHHGGPSDDSRTSQESCTVLGSA